MLVEFRVKNFRSIRDEQVLSLVAGKDKTFSDTHIISGGDYYPDLLKSSVIYGANASGKSNLLEAFAFMRDRVVSPKNIYEKYKGAGDLFFKLDKSSESSPNVFEVTFINEGIRYQYGFSLLRGRVTEEWLLAYKSDKPQVWFSRERESGRDEDVYKFSSYLKGQKKIWERSTRKDSLFLSVASGLNSEQLEPVFNWFVSKIDILSIFRQSEMRRTDSDFVNDTNFRQDILSIIRAADASITEVCREVRLIIEEDYSSRTASPLKENARLIFSRTNSDGEDVSFRYEEESRGTQRLFEFAFYILQSLNTGQTLVIDELESSMHPLIAQYIVALFNSGRNKKGAQLIFTTHNSGLLGANIFRRDQIWFVEKDGTGATVLYPLTDFSPRKSESLEKGYLAGRYGAIPFLSELNFPVIKNEE